MVADYLAHYAGSLAVSTLQRRLAALSKTHNALGHPNPTLNELVRSTMKGIRRTHTTAQRQVAPITKDRLIAMVSTCEPDLMGVRDRALLLIGFAGAFRRSELVALNCTDIEEVPEGLITTIARSKTDQEGKGRKIGIPYSSVDCQVLTSLRHS